MEEIYREDSLIQQALDNLVLSSGAMTALLITKGGTAVAEAGDRSYLNTTAMAALVAGMFSATFEVARMVGERQFSILLQQGESRHIHISLVSGSTMMVVIFEDYQRIGRVRHEARKASKIIAESLETKANEKGTSENIEVPAFKEYALNLIDRIFVSE
jgi:predicted regulator of Ras-like GTPase activity (Roadblock/LC7/MglB family)